MNSTLKNFISRYHPRYIRSLVYMAQQSEYHIRDYLAWFWRTRDFLRVEQRKTLVKTPKALLLLVLSFGGLILLYAFALWVLLVGVVWWKYLVFLLVVLGAPFILAYGLVVVLFLGRLMQWPVEYLLVDYAKRKLQAHKGLKIAIAGSFGKTTMREILKTVLGATKKVSAPPGSYNTPLGISSFIRGLKGDEEILIFEMGEYYKGDIQHLCALVRPDIGIITGVNEAHLEKFKDVEQTRATIFELADYLGDKPLYINGENELARKYTHAGNIFYTRTGVGKWKVERAQTGLQGTSFTLRNGSEELSVRSHLLGLHQVGPLVVAAHIASKLGLTAEQIEKGIDASKPFEHRLEPKMDAQGVTTLDDSYNGNPDGVRAVTEFLSSLQGHRRWYVTPGLVEMGPKKEEIHKEIGRQLARAGIEKVILIRTSVTPFIFAGLQEENYSGEVIWFDKALDAFSALPNLTVKGDTVLLQNDWPDQYA
ncbi:MAG: UDP-N-acetylmuramoyl-tripeptide--D-alanyl-D-alanine ligase [Candidatus Taylorbacteria bacterium]|nr:UDP-N-acetylmuramoyl-tripeptide--D-alanyl-D-alanine ligase [Candidatus Taylorbacteria bacterium]